MPLINEEYYIYEISCEGQIWKSSYKFLCKAKKTNLGT